MIFGERDSTRPRGTPRIVLGLLLLGLMLGGLWALSMIGPVAELMSRALPWRLG